MTVVVDIALGVFILNALIFIWAVGDMLYDAVRDLDDRIRLAKFERRYLRQMDALECAWQLDPPDRELRA